MTQPIPKEIVWAAITFARTVREYSYVTDDAVEAMFDAFDPSLKRQVLLALLTPDSYGIVRTVPNQPREKIRAIKEVRAVIGWGLKEAKEFIDAAETSQGIAVSKDWTPDQIHRLSEALKGTGYIMNY